MNIARIPFAQLINVSKIFTSGNQRTYAVNDVSLDLFPGEMIVLLGPSGSGKTTLLTTLAGFIQPTIGTVMLFGRPLGSYTQAHLQHLRAARIGFVFQTFFLIDALTVEENISIVSSFIGGQHDGAKEGIVPLLRQLNIAHLARKLPAELSQGEKQRVAIARAVINKPDLILADEPTASVDSSNSTDIILSLHGFAKEQNKCVIVTSHDSRVVAFADRLVEMEDGRVKSPLSHPRLHKQPTTSA